MTKTNYAERLRWIATQFEGHERNLGRKYALSELRSMLNSTSNEALQEMQAMREKTDG